MKDNILPAIDPNNRLAIEQAQLILGILNIMSQRIDLEYRYDRDELERLVGFAALLHRQTKGGPKTRASLLELDPVLAEGADVLDRARAEPSELVQAVRSLRAKVCQLIQAVAVDGEPASKDATLKATLDNAKEQLLRERSWLIMLGLDAYPGQVPPIESLIGAVPTFSRRDSG